MSAERPGQPDRIAKARLFAALDLPGEVRGGLEAWGARELRDPALRPVPAESLHMTLCFLGWVAEERIPEAAAEVAGLAPRPVPVSLRPEPVGKPARRPAFIAIEARSPAASELQAELSGALATAGLFEPEERPFWPHVTVARVRTAPGGRRPRRLAAWPGELPAGVVHTFGSVRVALYRSNLRPEGAQYQALANLNLPPVP